MIPKDQRYKFAIEKFIKSNIELQKKLANLDPIHAKNIGISIEEYRDYEAGKAFSAYAKQRGVDVTVLVIELCASNEKEKKEMLIERHKDIASALDIDWTEYAALNHIDE